nr:hypothetical protein [Pseudomonas sp. SWRI179]
MQTIRWRQSGPAPASREQEDSAVSVIDCDYLPTEKVKIPAELALLIIRKANAMAATFEEQALDQLTEDARRALRQGTAQRKLIREMPL